ncbi:uncharacterized protein [Palaemon carinicauda]|uniref:uncharacterized protein n=1 Tax=Palaemon carinicauda TaxID=392227 RepID=UPI0035B5A7FE
MIDFRVDGVYYWTYSTPVLRYIRNDGARYITFVANHVSMKRNGNDQKEWMYVNSGWNPADDATSFKQSERWRKGLKFLLKEECFWPTEPAHMLDGVGGLEVRCEIGPKGGRGYQKLATGLGWKSGKLVCIKTSTTIRGGSSSLELWGGRSYLLGTLFVKNRQLLVKGNAAVRHMLGRCIRCHRAHGKVIEHLMANLPLDRVQSGKPPFYRTGVDLLWSFFVKRGRAQIKHWGVIFTCLNIRAINLEVASNLTSDSFISAFRRFLACRGQVKTVRCDCGTNILGMRKVLDFSYEFFAGNKVRNELLHCEVEFIFNPLGTSNLGGLWEWLTGTVRRVLT